MVNVRSTIEGACESCLVAPVVQENITERLAEANGHEAAGNKTSAFLARSTIDRLTPQINRHIEENPCEFVQSGECPIVQYLAERAVHSIRT